MDNYYIQIKEHIINNEIYSKVKDYSKERYKIATYFEIGKLLTLAGKHYGEGIIKKYSIKLTNEFGKKYSTRLLYKMIQFYNFILKEKMPTLSAQLSWSHYEEIFKLENISKINYYIKITIEQNLSVRELRNKIKSNEYERLPKDTKLKLQNNNDIEIKDIIKDPIIIKNTNNIEILKEKTLQKLILEDIPSFLEELGPGFTFIKNEYKIKIGDTYNYIDLLLFNYEFNCFIVIELKITELKKEHIGQIEIYMNYIDNNIKKIHHDKTIGIIICKKDNKFIIEYSSDKRILCREYLLIPSK